MRSTFWTIEFYVVFKNLLDSSWLFWIFFGIFWVLLEFFRIFWDLLDSFWIFWNLLDAQEMFWGCLNWNLIEAIWSTVRSYWSLDGSLWVSGAPWVSRVSQILFLQLSAFKNWFKKYFLSSKYNKKNRTCVVQLTFPKSKFSQHYSLVEFSWYVEFKGKMELEWGREGFTTRSCKKNLDPCSQK